MNGLQIFVCLFDGAGRFHVPTGNLAVSAQLNATCICSDLVVIAPILKYLL